MSENTISTPASVAKGDDRNLVPVTPETALSFEDQAFLLWKKQRTFIIGTLVTITVALMAWFVVRGMQASREAEIRTAYGMATTIDAKRAFAREHAGHELGALALLLVADDSFLNVRYDEASREYATAATGLTEPMLQGRARIGEGAAKLKLGQTAEAERVLTAVAQDETALMSHRTQAYYVLASHAAGTGDAAKVRDTIGRLKALDPESYWANLGAVLQTRVEAENPGTSSLEIPAEAPPAAP